jgi:hypothetical protein
MKNHIITTLIFSVVIGGAVFVGLSDFGAKRKEVPRPSTLPVLESLSHGGLDDNAPIIGVFAGGEHRAYPLGALMRPDSHVVNDLLGRKPVTVTFCDIDDCVQVFTDPDKNLPLDIAVGGSNRLRHGKLLLRIGDRLYWQDTKQPLKGDAAPFPYAQVDYVRTTWGKWREAHPDSDLYFGR